jgi:hypothetical protein
MDGLGQTKTSIFSLLWWPVRQQTRSAALLFTTDRRFEVSNENFSTCSNSYIYTKEKSSQEKYIKQKYHLLMEVGS